MVILPSPGSVKGFSLFFWQCLFGLPCPLLWAHGLGQKAEETKRWLTHGRVRNLKESGFGSSRKRIRQSWELRAGVTMKTVLLLSFVLFALTPGAVTFAEVYHGFKQVKPEDCFSLDITRIQSLPPSWHKYGKFIKICPVKRTARSTAVVSIVSVWTEDYLNTKAVKTWEEFPYRGSVLILAAAFEPGDSVTVAFADQVRNSVLPFRPVRQSNPPLNRERRPRRGRTV